MNAFICLSYVQLMRACQLVTCGGEFSDSSDLYLGSYLFDDMQMINRIKQTHMFSNVYYINYEKFKKPQIISAYLEFKKKSYVPQNGYRKVISFNIEGIIQTVLFNMNKNNEGFEYHCMEDCPSIYDIYVPSEETSLVYKLLKIQKPCFHINTWWSSCIEFINIPMEFTKNVKKLPPIDICDKNLLNKLNYIFDYIEDPVLSNSDMLIMEESHFIDGFMVSNRDFEFYSELIERHNNIKFCIKLHPRTKHNRFEGMLPTVKNSKIPWELIVWNRSLDENKELIQVSIRCGTMLSDKMMFDLENKKIILIKLFEDSFNSVNGCKRIDKKMIEEYDLIKNTYKNPNNLFIPENLEQLESYFDNIGE